MPLEKYRRSLALYSVLLAHFLRATGSLPPSFTFLLAEEKNVTYANIEELFGNEKYYRAMKRLSDREKLVLFLTIVEEKRAGQVAEIMDTTKDNIWQIKSRAIKHFLRNVSEK